MADRTTHWDGCWRAHHECAVARVEELERADSEHRGVCSAIYQALGSGYRDPDRTTWPASIARMRRELDAARALIGEAVDAVATQVMKELTEGTWADEGEGE